MNFWTGLLLGIIIGWAIEWLLDWRFWRRDAREAAAEEQAVQERLALAEADRSELEDDWRSRLAAAEEEYEARLAAVEQEWQGRLNLNEQQWQDQFATLESDNTDLRARLADFLAGAAAGAAGAAVVSHVAGGQEEPPDGVAPELVVTVDEPADYTDEPLVEDAVVIGEVDDLEALDGVDADMLERLHLAGIDSVDGLAQADAPALAARLGVETDEAEGWINRARMALAAAGTAAVAVAVAKEVSADEEPVIAAPARPDDLTRIHGIGPKYARTLAANDITTFEALAAATPEELQAIIKPGRMQQINFDSWIAQAAAFAASRTVMTGDDLTELEGIGPVYAARLRDNGITSFAALAESDEATLQTIIDAPSWRRINYGDWIAQARLAAAGDQQGLTELQDRLFRRESDNIALIRGLGDRSATALHAAGITTFAALAAASADDVEQIVRGAGVRGGDYNAWIAEAQLRADGRRISRNRPRPTHIVSCPQDLSHVRGVGTVFEERLYMAGIGSYWELAETPADDLATILDIQDFQGVDLDAIKSSAMQLAVQGNTLGRAWDGTPPDDFEVLEGIGEIYESRLYEAGICTYEALAATTPERLAEICKAPPMRTPDYAAWIATATELAEEKRSS